jgi:primase-polymerase (primpol)-like protein
MALCSLLAFWTGGDAGRVDRLFRDSGLMREKWGEVHFSDGSTYGEKTVERAIAGTSEFYDPSTAVERTSTESGDGSAGTARTVSEGGTHAVERLESLHETIESLNRQIQTLEAENTQLRDALDEERARREELEARHGGDDSDSESLWTRFWRTVAPE